MYFNLHQAEVRICFIVRTKTSNLIYDLLRFVEAEGGTGLMGLVIKDEQETKSPGQQCFPLYSYIKALNHPTINLLR